MDSFVPLKERDALALEREALAESAYIRNVLPVLRTKDVECEEAGVPKMFVLHEAIL
jgi:hypothetical protein